jgi:hypothetical protein
MLDFLVRRSLRYAESDREEFPVVQKNGYAKETVNYREEASTGTDAIFGEPIVNLLRREVAQRMNRGINQWPVIISMANLNPCG